MRHNGVMTTGNQNAGGVEITDYTDYVPYIADLVRHKRETGGFSYRVFCRKSGFKSPVYLKWVIDRVRPISLKSAHKFAEGLSLDKRETQYFIMMVNYKEASDAQTKQYYYEQMLAWQKHRGGALTKDAYEYLSHWYYVAIRELVASSDFNGDLNWLRDRLGSDLTLWEIRNGLETLERLNLIRRDLKGRWQTAAKDLHTESEVRSVAAYNYHTEMLEAAGRTLTKLKPEKRDYQSLVAMLDNETFVRMKAKIEDFQKNLVKYLQQREQTRGKTRHDRELYAFNMQLFPLCAQGKGEV